MGNVKYERITRKVIVRMLEFPRSMKTLCIFPMRLTLLDLAPSYMIA